MSELRGINPRALMRLKAYRHRLNWQQYKTLRGQVLSGDDTGAMKGLERILRRKTNDSTGCGNHSGVC